LSIVSFEVEPDVASELLVVVFIVVVFDVFLLLIEVVVVVDVFSGVFDVVVFCTGTSNKKF